MREHQFLQDARFSRFLESVLQPGGAPAAPASDEVRPLSFGELGEGDLLQMLQDWVGEVDFEGQPACCEVIAELQQRRRISEA